MNIYEFKNRIKLIMDFNSRMNKESVPCSFQKIILKAYASMLCINLTDKMVDDII